MALFRKKTVGKPGEWFYCLKHEKVEEGPDCPGKERLGPYPSPEAAARAMETVHERNVAWDTDPRWNDDASPGSGSGGT